MTDAPRRMFACERERDSQLYYFGSREYVEELGRHLALPTVEVDVAVIPDDDPAGTHWGWQYDDGSVSMVWPTRAEFDKWVERLTSISSGRPVRLAVTPAPEENTARRETAK